MPYGYVRLTADLDGRAGHANTEVRSTVVIAIIIVVMVANNQVGIRMVDASGHACAVIADLPANLLGIGGMGERKPQSGRRHANQDFAHWIASAAYLIVKSVADPLVPAVSRFGAARALNAALR
jgi:hypothetical protein